MFVQLQCCGVNNYTDWFDINAWPDKERVPPECCVEEECPVEGHPDEWYQSVSNVYASIASVSLHLFDR